MSDTVDTETMTISEAADMVSSTKDNIATKSEVTDQSQSSSDEHGSNNKRDVQVKNGRNNIHCEVFLYKPATKFLFTVYSKWNVSP